MNLMPVIKNARVAVIGAGISGVSFAYFLNKLRPDVHITIFEKSSTVGGRIQSQNIVVDGEPILLEKGPRTLRGVRNGTLLIVDTLDQLGQGNQVEVLPRTSLANKKWLWSNSGLIQVPDPFTVSSFVKFLLHSEIIRPNLFWGMLKEPFVKPSTSDESVQSFFKRRFGNTILTDNVVSAILHGIYAGDVTKMSVKSIMPNLKYLEQDYGSIIRAIFSKLLLKLRVLRTRLPKLDPLADIRDNYKLISSTDLSELSNKLKKYPMIKFQDGLQVIPNTIAKYLSKQKNVKFVFNSDIKMIDIEKGTIETDKLETFDHIHSTINTRQLSKLIGSSRTAEILKDLHYVDIFIVNIYSKTKQLIPKGKNGFGFLVPRSANPSSNKAGLLGVIYDSDVEKNVTKFNNASTPPPVGDYEKITLMIGGWHYDDNATTESFRIRALKHILSDYLEINSSSLILRNEAELTDKTVSNLGDKDLLVSYNYLESCIPQYNVGYEAKKQELYGLLCNTKLSLGGMGYGVGIGIPDCFVSAFDTAVKLSSAQVPMEEVLITEEQATLMEKQMKEKVEKEDRERQAILEDEKSKYY